MKREQISAFGNLDHHAIRRSLAGIVFGQLRPEPAGLHAHCGIHAGIEVGGAAEHFGGDLVLLQRHARRVQGVLAQILEELAERFRSMQDGAAVQLLDLRVQRLPFNASGPSILHLTRD
jgi:hypothetical protein